MTTEFQKAVFAIDSKDDLEKIKHVKVGDRLDDPPHSPVKEVVYVHSAGTDEAAVVFFHEDGTVGHIFVKPFSI